MKVSRFVFAALFITGCGGAAAERTATSGQTPAEAAQKAGAIKTSTDPAVNPHAALMADFKTRVEKYAELHKDLAKGAAAQKEDTNPAQINAQKMALAARIQAARTTAKHGDIFFPEIRPVFRRLLARNPGPLRNEEIQRLFREIMSACLAQEEPLKVAYLGPEGTFSQTATYRHFGHAVRALALSSVDEIFH